MTDEHWQTLIRNIDRGRCTPFLGAEAAAGALPPRSQIAQEWAERFGCPLAERDDLSRVAQFMAQGDRLLPRYEMVDRLKGVTPPGEKLY